MHDNRAEGVGCKHRMISQIIQRVIMGFTMSSLVRPTAFDSSVTNAQYAQCSEALID
jgi:hypothetical protein